MALNMKKVAVSILMALPAAALAQQNGGVDWSPVQFRGDPYVYQYITVQPGQYILQPGIPACGDHRDTRMADTARAATTLALARTGVGAPLAYVGGSLAGQFVSQFQNEVGYMGGSIAQLLSDIGASPRYAACGTIALVVPQGYHVAKVSAFAWNANQNVMSLPVEATTCNVPQEPYLKCHVPDGAWTLLQNGNVVVGTFINWARETRTAFVSVSFEPN